MVNIGTTWCTFQPQAPLPPYNNNNNNNNNSNNNNNKKHPEKIYIFQKKNVFFYFWMELSSPKPKRFLIYLKKKHFSYISGWNFPTPSSKNKTKTTLKKFLMLFQKTFSHISGWLLIRHKNKKPYSYPRLTANILWDDCWLGIKKNIFNMGWLLI